VAISKFTGTGVIITVPLLIAVLLFQRCIVAGLTAGGGK
jgi:multiple sugar transport system permease protein